MSMPVPALPLHPADEYVRAIVEMLRADAVLAPFLFPSWSPSLGPLDVRIYSSGVELPEDAAIRAALPRVLIETVAYPFVTEQPAGQAGLADVPVYTHVLVPKEREEHGKIIDAYLSRLLVSTPLNTVRIITASLSLDGQRRVGRISGFDDAWEVVTQYRSPFVGVIA